MALMKSRPLLLPLCSLIAGIVAAGSYGFYVPDVYLPVFFIITVLTIFIPSSRYYLIAVYLLVFLCANSVMRPILTPDKNSWLLQQKLSGDLLVEGVIQGRPVVRGEGCRLLLRPDYILSEVEEFHLSGLLLLHVGSRVEKFASGDRVRFLAKLRAPRNFGTPGEFDAERFYALKGIAATASVPNEDALVMIRSGSSYSFQRYFDLKADRIGMFITDCVPPVEAGILKALLIGDSGDIPQELKDAYSRTGVNHILSISGFHVGIIALALFQSWYLFGRFIPSLLLYLNLRRVAYAASFPLILYYLFLSGAAPATARAVIMLGFLMVGLLVEREFDKINTLILAAFVLLLMNPAVFYDISFQLSFIALWGIMVLTPLFMSRFQALKQKRLYNLLLILAASFAAITATILPVAYYFQQASLTGLVSNLLVVPLLGYGAVISGFIAIPLIDYFPQLAGLLFNLAGFLTAISNSCIELFDRLPLLPFFVPTAADIFILIIALMVITLAENSSYRLGVLVAVPFVVITCHYLPASGDGDVLRIDFFSVGQGEATLVTFPDQKRMLIDGGGALHGEGWDVGRRLLLPALRKLGVQRVDYLVLSHPHPDHLQGVIAVAEDMSVGEFWESGAAGGVDYHRLKRILAIRNVKVKRVNASTQPFEVSGVRFKILHPLLGTGQGNYKANNNDDSLVFRMETGFFSALFTGDIGCQEEKRLLADGALLKCTLLKVPHHGSRYSVLPEFFRAASPEIALIGAGYHNFFGLPSSEAVKQLRTLGTKIYRTDYDGTITLKVSPESKNLVISALKRHFN